MDRRSGKPAPGTSLGARRRAIVAAAAIVFAACSGTGGAVSNPPSGPPTSSAASGAPSQAGTTVSGTIELYTSVSQPTVDAELNGLHALYPNLKVSVFRAPTGQINARIAADERTGGLQADVVWFSDPLSMQALAQRDLLLNWTPDDLSGIPVGFRTPSFFGAAVLYVVLVAHAGLSPMPVSWQDLTNPAYKDAVVMPDPGFAGSAFGALGFFSQTAGYGTDFYARLKANGTVQVQAPDDVVSGVAQGRYKVGITIDKSAQIAIAKGSPVTSIWPEPGAIAVYSPIAVATSSRNPAAAKAFVEFVLSLAGQRAVASTAAHPARTDSGGPPVGGPVVSIDWSRAYGQQVQLLQDYRSLFGG